MNIWREHGSRQSNDIKQNKQQIHHHSRDVHQKNIREIDVAPNT